MYYTEAEVQMSKPSYDRRKTRRAMLIAPLVALIGIVPLVFQLNLSIVQFLLMMVAAILVSYLFGLIIALPGYLILKSLGYGQAMYLMAYAIVIVIALPIVLGDIYALLSLAPPILLVAGAFCYLRGPIDASGQSEAV